MYLKTELYELVRTDERIFDFIQEGILDGLWYWDLENPENEWMSARFWEVLGYHPGEMPHKSSAWQGLINQDDLKLATENLVKHCENPNHPYDQIVRYTHKDGSIKWIHCRGMAIRNAEGKPVRMLGAHQDITGIKNSETTLLKTQKSAEESEEKYRAIFENINDAVFIHEILPNGEPGKYLFFNQAAIRLLGYTSEELNDLSPRELDDPECSKRYIPLVMKQLKENRKSKFEAVQIAKDGRKIDVEVNAVVVKFGEVDHIISVCRDITEKKTSQRILKENEQFLSAIYKGINHSIFVVDVLKEGDFHYAGLNPYHEKLTGINTEFIKGKRPEDVLPDEDAIKVRNRYAECVAMKQTIAYEEWLPFQGNDICWETALYPQIDESGNVCQIIGTSYEITERKQTQQLIQDKSDKIALQNEELNQANKALIAAKEKAEESEKLFKSVIENAPDGVVIVNEHGRFKYISPNAGRLFGYNIDESIGLSGDDFTHPDDLPKVLKTLESILTDPSQKPKMEYRFKRKNGEFRWIETTFTNLLSDKVINGIVLNFTDITERKQIFDELLLAKEKAEENEKRFRNAIENTPIPTAIARTTGEAIYLNRQFVQTYGYTLQDIPAIEDWYRQAHPDPQYRKETIEDWNREVEQSIKNGTPTRVREYQITCKNGEIKTVAVSAYFENDLIVALFQDITERKKAEASLQQIEWMLAGKREKYDNLIPGYGDLTELNKNGLILSSVGQEQLINISTEYLDLLETSSAVYEKNGDYAMGLFSSSWCKMMDAASRTLCNTESNEDALQCGRWHCHESCWKEASLSAITSNEPADIACKGGIRLYSVPIHVKGEVIGAINFGYGEPPRTEDELRYLSDLYQIPLEELKKAKDEYQVRPQFIIDLAKKRLHISAQFIGHLIERRQAEDALSKSEERFALANDASEQGIWDWNVETNEIFYSEQWKRQIGYEDHEIENDFGTWVDHLHPDEMLEKQRAVQAYLDKPTGHFLLEFRFRHKNGSYRWIHNKASSLLNKEGKVVRLFGTHTDVTDRKAAEQLLQEKNEEIAARNEEMAVQNEELKQVNEELLLAKRKTEESEERFNLAMKASNDGLFDWNLETNEIYYSPAWKEMLGYEAHELPNDFSVWEKTTDPEDVKKSWVLQQKLIAKQIDRFVIEFKMKHKDGHWIDVLAKAEAVFNEHGEAVRIVGTHTDITERKQAEEALRDSELRFRSLVNTINSGVAFYKVINDGKSGSDYIIQSFNDFALKHENLTKEEALGKSLKDIRPEIDDYGLIDTFREVWKTGKPAYFPAKLYIDEKYANYYENRVFRISTGEIVAVYDDVTERESVHLDLKKALEKAQEADRLKSAFLANMSHEIRTPMNGIIGFADLLKEPDLTGDQLLQYVGIIEKSGVRMLNIINEIVDISKIEAGLTDLNFNETDINEQIEFIYTFFKPEADAKGIHLAMNLSLPRIAAIIQTDREKVYAILTNLVKNAIKYTREGSIELGYRLSLETQSIVLQFYVSDTGIGIPKERHVAIFERFVQADIEDRMAYQGAGLGLAISKAYVEMLGGKIWVDSQEGIGSTFYFTLPYHKAPQKENRQAAHASSENDLAARKLKILIAEDDEVSEMLIDHYIQMFGKEILKAGTGVEAVEVCRNNPDIDLIFMDIRMPEMGGYEATKQIRAFNPGIVIIAQTAYGMTGDREKAIEAGCDDYIAKPINKTELQRMIQKYFGN